MPSTLHQKVKFVVDENLIIVIAEEDMVATTTISTPYIEVKEDATECFFRSFEVATATNTKGGLGMPTSRLSQNTRMSLKQTVGKRAKAGYGLGRDPQGIQRVVLGTPKHDRYGLGYQLGNQDKNEQMGRQKGSRMASSKLIIPLMHQTFRSVGYINSSSSRECEDIVAPFFTFAINTTRKDEKMAESACPTVYSCPPNFELNNWSTVEVPVISDLSQ